MYEIGIPADATLRSYDYAAASDSTALHTGSDTLVQQQPAEETDINYIMRKYSAMGSFPLQDYAGGIYADISGVTDWYSALETIERARDQFMTLPPDVREKFKNDPGQLIEFAQNATPEEYMRVFAPAEPVATVEPGGEV